MIYELYYIAAYNHEANDWRRFAVSGEDGAAAALDFDDFAQLSGWKRETCRYICAVHDYVFVEL